MQIKTAFVLLAAVTSSVAWGCGSSNGQSPGNPAAVRASLHRSKNCSDLLGDLKSDAKYKVDSSIDEQIAAIRKCAAVAGDAQCAYAYGGGGGLVVNGGAAEATPTAAPKASDDSATAASSFSETNVQVKGVDEADFVKNDGKNIYLLHGNAFKVMNAWPAAELKEVSSLDLEGSPSEMFVENGKVVVYSQVNGADVFKAAGVTPKTAYQDYYAKGGPVGTSDIAPVVPRGGGGTPTTYAPLTKITVMQLDGTTPHVTREVYFEGSYLSARRVGDNVRTVIQGFQYGPQLKYGIYELPRYASTNGSASPTTYPQTGSAMIGALEELRQANLALIEASQLSDWLPYTFVKQDGGVSAQTVACEDFYVPTAGSTAAGLTEIASLDLANPTALPKQSAILGAADTVYGTADTLYLAAHAWLPIPIAWSASGSASSGAVSGSPGEASPPPTKMTGGAATQSVPVGQALPITTFPSSMTHIHKFDFKTDPTFPNYVASGTVVGGVKDQFSLDDKDGYLRIATTEQRSYLDSNDQYVPADATANRPSNVNHVFVLGVNGEWLDTVGDVGELAANESIQSVRFVDGRGYVVTFRQVDPLFVVDLTNPRAPNLVGALSIPGFSEYMQPMDENHLLTIGKDADPTTGRTKGLSLQIFDVSNGKAPVLVQKFAYSGSEYGYSEAEYDHKAFTYFADKNLLAFPFYAYDANNNGGMKSTLEIFHVDVASGFAKLGSIDHSAQFVNRPTGFCGGYFTPSVRRGIFLENFVYSVSYAGVIAKDSNALAQAGTSVTLESPVPNVGYGPACAPGL